MIEYVLGLAFSEDGRSILAILKNHPEWQKGKLNGLGGKVEEGESYKDAMERKFYEECGLRMMPWKRIGRMQGDHPAGPFNCVVFSCFTDRIYAAKKDLTDEIVEVYAADTFINVPCITALETLIPFALADHEGCDAAITLTYRVPSSNLYVNGKLVYEKPKLTTSFFGRQDAEPISQDEEAEIKDVADALDEAVECAREMMAAGELIHKPARFTASMRGANLFNDAFDIINGERQTMYGSPEDSFEMIAERWTQCLRSRGKLRGSKDIAREDVAFMMVDYKMARECNQAKRDNRVDVVGYMGILDDMED